MNWKILLVGLIILTGIVGTAYAAPNESNTIKSLEISEMWTFVTTNESEIGIFWEIKNNFPNENEQIYPIEIKCFYENKEFFHKLITIKWFASHGLFRRYALNEKYDPQKEIRIELVDRNDNLIDSKSQYEPPRYKFDFNQQKADIQLVNLSITKRLKPFRFWDYYYNLKFTIKNINESYAFRGKIDFGDVGNNSGWKVHYNDIILAPSQSFEIEQSGLTEEEMKNVKTELRACIFC